MLYFSCCSLFVTQDHRFECARLRNRFSRAIFGGELDNDLSYNLWFAFETKGIISEMF